MAQDGDVNRLPESAIVDSAIKFTEVVYDYLIIGGGTAGLVVAARLSENPNVQVGVIEAGKNKTDDMLVNIPALFGKTVWDPEYDWMLTSVPQEHNGGRVHSLPRGRVVGGSSAINHMMYVRGSSEDYDDWAAFGEGWDFANVAKYFRKHQILDPIDPSIKERGFMPFVEEFHGKEGPIHTSFNDFRVPFENDFIHACDDEFGMKERPRDPWSGDHIGFYSSLGTVDRTDHPGTRSYSGSGYLVPNLNRKNLRVLPEGYVTTLILEGNTAVGTNFAHGGQEYKVYAKQEVIVSCGTYKSPQILELSGIGDPEVLQAARVDVKVENRGVGANLQDHQMAVLGYTMADGVGTLDGLRSGDAAEKQQKIYAEKKTGALAATSCCMGFYPYSLLVSREELENTIKMIEDTPNPTPFQKKQNEQIVAHLRRPTSASMQFVLVPATIDLDNGIGAQNQLYPGPKEGNNDGVVFAACTEYPVARGTCHISSSDPFKPPQIDPAYAAHPADAAIVAAGCRIMDKVAKNPRVKPQIAKRYAPPETSDLQALENGLKFFKEYAMGEFHPIGSCGMGDAVDERLRVKGVKNLRVIDASIMPTHVSGNICSTVYMIGEKGADLIKEDSLSFGRF